jgi:hypothetical protein
MDYIISEQKFIKIDSDSVTHIEAVLFVASSETIPDYDDIPNTLLVPGSIAIVPSETKIYVLDLDNEWKEWGAEEDTRSVSAPATLTKQAPEETRGEPDIAEDEEPMEEEVKEVKKDESSVKFTPFE